MGVLIGDGKSSRGRCRVTAGRCGEPGGGGGDDDNALEAFPDTGSCVAELAFCAFFPCRGDSFKDASGADAANRCTQGR